MGKRRKGREIVLQSFYASQISGASLLDTLGDQLTRRESADETSEFAKDLGNKVSINEAELKRWLGNLVSGNWDVKRLGVLERSILTMGLAELKYSPDVPYKVAINEALELTRRYCDEGAVGFVNGVLDRAASQMNPKPTAEDGEPR
ncbi:MAG: transcription antitermination factor NusB [Gemmatimonadales bacterium]|nr:transcription antitermination factor NusB [Gemmatimonadales bacterium]